MQPRINVITLGTKNIKQSRKFYEQGLGWKASSTSNEHFVAFQLGGIILCLYPETLLAEDAMTTISNERAFCGFTLAHNVASKDEVDAVLKKAVASGAKLQKAAQDVFWGGYSGYFSDPDGHFWEVAWNPHWTLTNDGRVHLPE
jgi:uncharacterized protein